MVLRWYRKVHGPLGKPGVNHGDLAARSRLAKKAVANVSAAKSNAAKSMNVIMSSSGGVTEVVRRMLIERSIDGTVTAEADLREIGLTSLDMVDLVLSVECEFDLQIPEAQITPANFRSISAIDALVTALRS
jgi:acyl carrier protein